MSEDFLQHIWKFKLFNHQKLQTVAGEDLSIIKCGEHNSDAGPDFFNAKIKIGETIWAGNVEIHLRSSDWQKHRHQVNAAYDNIILHVVFENDIPLFRNSGETIPTLELKSRINLNQYQKFRQLQQSKDWVACQNQVAQVPEIVLNTWLQRILIERLEQKSQAITQTLHLLNNNWEETFYRHLARNFGQKINSDVFESLAKSLPLSVLGKHKNSLFQIEALLFGQAGMLAQNFSDEYPQQLKREYEFLQKKYKLLPLENHLWKFLRLRPANFPTIRIALFANLLYNSNGLFALITATNELPKFFNCVASDYWTTHYVFDKISIKREKKSGQDFASLLIINTVVPFLFVYGKHKDEEQFKERAFTWLESSTVENNSIISNWHNIGLKAKNALESQALLQLKSNYCQHKKCLHCSIGNHLLKQH
jgi:Protein of unknown function (DUF2851)